MTRRLAWALWLAIVGTFLGLVASGATAEDGEGSAIAYTVFVVAFATVGALVTSRQPRNPIGWILLGAGFAFTMGGLSEGAGTTLLTWIGTWIFIAGMGPAITFGLLLFPDGGLPSPRWRPVARLAAAAVALFVVGIALEPGRFEGTRIENAFGLDAVPGLPGAMATAGAIALALAIAGSIASLFARFRRARSIERQQLKWLTYAAAILAVALLAASVVGAVVEGERGVDLTNLIVTLGLATVPVAMGIAILRHRLYDIDVVINRTLVYGALTATLAAAYLGSVLLIGLAVGDSDVAVAASTLAVAALFRPARARIQAAVDRRFYRRRYDAAHTLETFSTRLRDELDLEALGADLRGVVRDTVQPAHVSLWLRSRNDFRTQGP
jgi:hypothetical protein